MPRHQAGVSSNREAVIEVAGSEIAGGAGAHALFEEIAQRGRCNSVLVGACPGRNHDDAVARAAPSPQDVLLGEDRSSCRPAAPASGAD